eukprot:CAMPEP_0178403808 /NCGR_PEP_ID=MMETSP0689_2-20121128/17560_1 /TAXON_ID=160604 /ORGANISM="Amphidinium massartii, Strain CS-259" /LENGTH=327 /DNA_ID=CAMNT_0020024775 /DNA_START=122 /DNA_END=1105 /DNA_ORIENTATION=-
MTIIKLFVYSLNGIGSAYRPPRQVSIDSQSNVVELKTKVEKLLAQPVGVLIPPFCASLAIPERSLKDCGLSDGHELRVILGHVPRLHLRNVRHSYIPCIGSHTICVWEQTPALANRLKEEGQEAPAALFSTARVYAGGSIVTFGEADYGGSPGAVDDELQSGVMVHVAATDSAFAALCVPKAASDSGDASEASAAATTPSSSAGYRVIAWGSAEGGGDASGVQDRLEAGIIEVISSRAAFAARTAGGGVITWGNKVAGGNSEDVKDQLEFGVLRVDADGDSAFLALRDSGDIVRWGFWSKRPPRGGLRVDELPNVACKESASELEES